MLSFRRPKGGRISETFTYYVLEILHFALNDIIN